MYDGVLRLVDHSWEWRWLPLPFRMQMSTSKQFARALPTYKTYTGVGKQHQQQEKQQRTSVIYMLTNRIQSLIEIALVPGGRVLCSVGCPSGPSTIPPSRGRFVYVYEWRIYSVWWTRNTIFRVCVAAEKSTELNAQVYAIYLHATLFAYRETYTNAANLPRSTCILYIVWNRCADGIVKCGNYQIPIDFPGCWRCPLVITVSLVRLLLLPADVALLLFMLLPKYELM